MTETAPLQSDAADSLRTVKARPLGVVMTTWRKELASLFYSPVGWAILVLFYVLRGWEVSSLVQVARAYGLDGEQFAIAYLNRGSSLILMMLAPAILTMRTFAEERRTGSLEVLLTAPVRDAEIVAGKYLAALTFFLVLLLPSLPILAMLRGDEYVGAAIAWGPVLSGYFGAILVGGFMLSVGCFTSSVTDNQVLASLAAILVSAALLFAPGLVAPYLAQQGLAAAETADGFGERLLATIEDDLLVPLLRQIDVMDHLRSWFFRGVINSSHVVFYLAGSLFFLFMTTRSLEARRWR